MKFFIATPFTQGRDRAPARSMYKAIGVANNWTETMNCKYKLRDLAVYVKEGIRAAGGTPMEFNTIAISDGITMVRGHERVASSAFRE